MDKKDIVKLLNIAVNSKGFGAGYEYYDKSCIDEYVSKKDLRQGLKDGTIVKIGKFFGVKNERKNRIQ